MMSKGKALTHKEINRLIAEYMQAYRMVYGPVMADSRVLIYKKSWFVFCDRELYEANPKNIVGVPYSVKEIEEMTRSMMWLLNWGSTRCPSLAG
jgi:hypothetical protein